MSDAPRLYSIQELAAILGINESTVYRWERRGLIPLPPLRKGRKRLYTTASVKDIQRRLLAAGLWSGGNFDQARRKSKVRLVSHPDPALRAIIKARRTVRARLEAGCR